MSTRVELEAVLAAAEADWRGAKDELERAQANLARASADWERLLAERRSAVSDRRKANGTWNQPFPDRRKAASDRRIPEADIRALSRAVTERHQAYLGQSKAEADCAAARSKLDAAADAWNRAIAALDAQERVRRKA